eukprot:2904486-Pleurochrysis_carterae.AAC.2
MRAIKKERQVASPQGLEQSDHPKRIDGEAEKRNRNYWLRCVRKETEGRKGVKRKGSGCSNAGYECCGAHASALSSQVACRARVLACAPSARARASSDPSDAADREARILGTESAWPSRSGVGTRIGA